MESVAELTPVERRGRIWLKRDDLYEYAGATGGKARALRALCLQALEEGLPGVVTACSRQSPQLERVPAIARELGLHCRMHVPDGELTPEMSQALALGSQLVLQRPGYLNVLRSRARADAAELGWFEVPFGCEAQVTVDATAAQVENLPFGSFVRLVVPVGSGMTLAGVTWGLERAGELRPPVLGVSIGADPRPRLNRWAHPWWSDWCVLEENRTQYGRGTPMHLGGVALHPEYEAKCVPYLEPGDLLWVVGS
jgi:1-aminocyclopropane-1-carboxylate deaminase/D-cysteine desulfhydrase-like pyridoxal-dependent ACC family enzyme